jgi:hypothetical protein
MEPQHSNQSTYNFQRYQEVACGVQQAGQLYSAHRSHGHMGSLQTNSDAQMFIF